MKRGVVTDGRNVTGQRDTREHDGGRVKEELCDVALRGWSLPGEPRVEAPAQLTLGMQSTRDVDIGLPDAAQVMSKSS